MKTLKQKIINILLNKNIFYRTKEELALKKADNIIEEIKEWLQQKQNTVIPLHKEMQIGFNKAINELLEELKT